MAFSPRFLDELKSRVGLAEVIGRRVRLQKKGREHSGLCPFHNEKTPSFTVNEDKGFYHCFGCGEHGSVFDFVMKTDNLSFPEAVELLAAEVGVKVPVETPEERQRAERAKGLYDVMEAAAVFFEKQMRLPVGKAALDYLLDRGISEESIAKFRLGYAPDNRGSLRTALSKEGMTDAQMIEAGLLIQPDNRGKSPYDRFRGRAMFAITDRPGRVIGFGGRILGEGEPKYLNSPETPLFHKGRALYGMPQSLANARKQNSLIVTEGYTDVIALHQAGFTMTVAPLGTALTEDQIQLMWRVVPEPCLCFDGDAAGQRAAKRAAERALPLLKPEHSLRFVTLPEGEDPDSLIKAKGAGAMTELIATAQPLSEIIWRVETHGHPLDTPEARAGLERRLRDTAMRIGDETVQRYYLNAFKDRLWKEFRKIRDAANTGKSGRFAPSSQMAEKSGSATKVDRKWLQQAILLTTLITHPELFDQLGEQLGVLHFSSPDLDKLRQEVLKTLALNEETGSGLDFASICDHLERTGFSEQMGGLLSRQVYDHASFARPDTQFNVARKGWEQQLRLLQRDQLLDEIAVVEKRLAKDPTREDFDLLKSLKDTADKVEDAEPEYNNGGVPTGNVA